VAAITQADRACDGFVEAKANGKTGVNRWLWAALSAPYEVPERERLTGPLEDLDLGCRKASNSQLRMDLTAKR
jgi:hypothetical protein